MDSTILYFALGLSLIANVVLLAKLVRSKRNLFIVVRNLVRISVRHTQTRARVHELLGVIREQDKAMQAQRVQIMRARMHGYNRCIWVNGKRGN